MPIADEMNVRKWQQFENLRTRFYFGRSVARPFIRSLVLLVILAGLNAPSLFAIAPAPQVRFDQTPPNPDVPAQVLIGEDVTFRVRFRNTLSTNAVMGHGPFVDLVLDAGGANLLKAPQTPACLCDGMTLVKANIIQVNGGPVPLVTYQSLAPCVPLPLKVPLSHPYPGILPVLVPAGSQLVTLELPFGSFDPTQPEIVIEVTVRVSNRADVNTPLKIYARGGFRFGATPGLDAPPDWPVVSDVVSGVPPFNQQTDSTLWAAQEQTVTTIFLVNKKYLGPEDETVSGPNFLRRYQINLDIANGQTIQNLTVTDRLPGNLAFHAVLPITTSCFQPVQLPIPDQANSGAANWLILKCSSITGVTGPDASIVFEFFVPERDAGNNLILSNSCASVQSINDFRAEGDWTPLDVCDTSPVHVVSDVTPADHTLADKCVAIQKTVADLSGASPPTKPIPGDTLQYSLNFQLSDFKTAGGLKVEDILSDGQTILPSSLMLTVTDQCGTTSGPIPASAWTQSILSCSAGAPPPRTKLAISISAAMVSLAGSTGPWRHRSGILTGGHAAAPLSNVPATGTITFRTVISDAFQCPVAPPHDAFVDKDDPLTNSVRMDAALVANGGSCPPPSIPSSTGFFAVDVSAVKILIAEGPLEKSVYAVKRGSAELCGPNTSPCAVGPDVFPGDAVTFRLKKVIPSGDAESLTIQDWLPVPTFSVAGGVFGNSVCGIPAVGNSCLGPGNTLSVAPPPVYSTDAATNSLKFNYGSFNDPANQTHTIDLLFTRAVSNTPFADGLYVTNEAMECESDSFGVTICQTAIAQVHVREPVLRITKGVVAGNTQNAVFSPTQVGPVPFSLPGSSCRRFSGTINSANLAVTPINSNVSGLDAYDCITFAIVVENRGGSPAYDIKLRDIFPLDASSNLECFDPNFATFCVTDGTGAPLPFTAGSGFLNGNNPITLQNPLPGLNSSGSNIVVITFDACVIREIKPRCCDNIAKVDSYSSTPGGPDFVGGNFGGPFQDTGQLCVLPRATKLIKTTSESHTAGTPSGAPVSPEQLAIGEVVRYRLEVVVPESVSPNNYKLQEFLPAGLSYLPGTAIVTTITSGITASSAVPIVTGGPFNCAGGSPLFDFGNVTNSNNNATQELIVLEFNALVCNSASNQNGAARINSFAVLVNGQQVAANSVAAVVVEPNIAMTKIAAAPSMTIGAAVAYTITLSNNGTATAFDVRLTDSLPACLTNLSNVQINTSGAVTGLMNSTLGSNLLLTVGSIPVNGSVTLQYSASLKCLDCSQLLNSAKVTWTSLPGIQGTTVNTTNSPTPGTSGLPDGERESSGGVNDYAAVASAGLCCLQVSNPSTSCNANNSFTHTFTVTNFSSATVSAINLSAISPMNMILTPGSIAIPPLAPGASTTVSVTISGPGVVSGTTVCFNVRLVGPGGVVCEVRQCITLPGCCVAPPRTMVVWYPLDELQGATVINDIAPQTGGTFVNNLGTPVPGPLGTGAGAGPRPVAGQVGGALYFTGQPYIAVPLQNDLNFIVGSFSIDAWVRAVGCGPGFLSPIVDKFDTSTNTGYALYLEQPTAGSAVIKLRVNGSTFTSSTSFTANANPVTNTGSWFHVAVTVNASTGVGTFYLNGVPTGATFPAAAAPVMSTVPLWIGQIRPLGSRCEIAIDELEIFGRALTQAEVQSISNAGSGGKCRSGIICVTKFEDPNGNGSKDTGEPQLPAWTFNVSNSSGIQIGAITTNSAGKLPTCLAVPPGPHTITEVLQPGWTPTTPNPQTVTALPGQTINLSFGNKQGKRLRAPRR